jgi:tetratricopeptide (TPR) repeat protein
LLGSEHPDVAQSLYDLARVLREEGKLADAEAQHREALAIRKKLPETQGQAVAESLADLARTLLMEKRFIAAETVARECLALREQRWPKDWETFEARSLLGRSLVGQLKPAEAEPLLLAGYRDMRDGAGNIPAWEKRRLHDALKALIEFYDGTGKPAEAAKWKQELPPSGA